MIKIRIHFPALIGKNVPTEVSLSARAGMTIEDLIDEMHEKFDIPREKYNKHSERLVNAFTGQVVMKNAETIGYFSDNGYKPNRGYKQTVKSGDEINIFFIVAGG